MKLVSEELSAAIVTHEMAYRAVREALSVATLEGTEIYPVINASGAAQHNEFTVKAASTGELSGLKIGSFWPGNTNLGLARHSSTIVLIDENSGRIAFVVEAGVVNGYRTAAANAVAAELLARKEASTLTVFGSGHQAAFECHAIARIRDIKTILVVARNASSGAKMCRTLVSQGLNARLAGADEACAQSDIIVTATTARAPLFDVQAVAPGTHIASMGSDSLGKQELPSELLSSASLFCDLPAQSCRIGEYQHAPSHIQPTAIGDVITGKHRGRLDNDEITIFDSSGISIQDLYMARELLAELALNNET